MVPYPDSNTDRASDGHELDVPGAQAALRLAVYLLDLVGRVGAVVVERLNLAILDRVAARGSIGDDALLIGLVPHVDER